MTNNAILGGIIKPGRPIAPPIRRYFRADRPFHYEIRSTKENLSLFVGIIFALTSASINPQPPPIFKVDRPFHVKIIRTQNSPNKDSSDAKLELFTAHVVDPSV
ncbi:hypothetical protein M0804_002532 [Polistes exclamans]|nr:hypothetical protein M0804_002532 [Polistes exclamans]